MDIERIDTIPPPPPVINEIEEVPENVETVNQPVEENTETERAVDLFA